MADGIAFDEMDMRDIGDENAADAAMAEELTMTFGVGAGTMTAPMDTGAGHLASGIAEEIPDEGTADYIATAAAAAMGDIGVGDAVSSSGASGSADVPEVAAPPVSRPEPWLALSEVSSSGYVYDAQPRSVLRIQRGKPARSVTVSCYRHAGCKLLLTEERCPDDATLKRWLYETPAPPAGASRDEARRLAQEHMALGKGRWGGKRS